MAAQEILEIKGVWTSEEVRKIKAWVSGSEAKVKFSESNIKAEEQSQKIQQIAHVDMDKLKIPFTFSL